MSSFLCIHGTNSVGAHYHHVLLTSDGVTSDPQCQQPQEVTAPTASHRNNPVIYKSIYNIHRGNVAPVQIQCSYYVYLNYETMLRKVHHEYKYIIHSECYSLPQKTLSPSDGLQT